MEDSNESPTEGKSSEKGEETEGAATGEQDDEEEQTFKVVIR